MDSDRGKKRAKKMEQRCHFKIIGSGSGFHYFLWQGTSKTKKIPPVDELLFFIFLRSVKAGGHRASDFSLSGDLGAGALENSGKGRMARRQQGPQQAARVQEAPGQEDTLCFQLRFCDLSAKRGFTKRKPPEHSHSFWLIRLVFILTGISCLPSHFSSMLPGRI